MLPRRPRVPPVFAVQRHGPDALRRLGTAYDELLTDTGAPLTCRRTWLQAWVDCYRDWEPWVIAVPAGDGGLAAVAALARRRRGAMVQVTAIGLGPSDETRLPARDTAAAERLAGALRTALAQQPMPWSLHVDQLPPDCDVARAVLHALPLGALTPGDGLPRAHVGSATSWTQLLSKSARQTERSARNRIAAHGIALEQVWTTGPEVGALLPELMAVHRARDLALGRRPDHDDPCAAAFYQQVVRDHAASGQVEVLRILLDGRTGAFVLGFRDARSFCVWDARLAPEAAAYSAGRLASVAALRRVVEDPALDVLDWMRGEEPYKLSSATAVDPTVVLRAWSSPPARWPHATLDSLRRLRSRSPAAARLFAALGRPAPPSVAAPARVPAATSAAAQPPRGAPGEGLRAVPPD